jgi:hypothetical protein
MELTNLLKIPWADSGLFSFFFRFLQWCRDKVTGLFIARAQFSWLPCFSVDEGWKIAFCFSLLPSSHLIFFPLLLFVPISWCLRFFTIHQILCDPDYFFFPFLFLSIRTWTWRRKGGRKVKKEETVKMDENVISQRIHMPRLSCRIHSCNRKKMDDTGARGLVAVHH